jgi:hypothetical protein
MIPPEAPAGGLVGQAVLDDETDGQSHDPFGVMTAGGGQVATVGVEVLTAGGAVVLGVGQDDVTWPRGGEVAEVVECAWEDAVAIGTVAAARARPPPIVAAALAGLGLGQILDAGDPLGGIRQVFSGAWQGVVLL